MIVTRAAPTVLSHGAHKSPDDGMCLTEAVAWMAGEPHTDRPKCCSPVLATFGRRWNDGMRSDEERAQLLPYVCRLVGTAGDPAADERRRWMALDWLCRVYVPVWLDLSGLAAHAAALRDQRPIDSVAAGDAARAAARDAAWAAARAATRDATGDAAWDAAGDAAWAAARDAAWAAARAAAWDAAGDAARAAARDAAWAAARAAAWAAARDATGDAAWAAAWDAAWAAAWDAARAAARDATGDAARDAARAALKPAVQRLQTSAHDLFDRMINAS